MGFGGVLGRGELNTPSESGAPVPFPRLNPVVIVYVPPSPNSRTGLQA